MSDELICPECGQPVARPEDVMQNLLVCPSCAHQFFIEISPPDEEDEESTRLAAQRELDQARDLDSSRIRAFSVERRSIIRQRSYFITAAGACGVAILQSLYWLIRGRAYADSSPFTGMQKLCLIVLILWAVAGVRFFLRKARTLQVEMQKPLLQDPAEPPDFEPLNDGSQAWKNLEEMNQPPDEE